MSERGFDPTAEFLLGMHWLNLFEQADRHGLVWRCKGCQETVTSRERERHFRNHVRARDQRERARQGRIHQQRVTQLARAREHLHREGTSL